MVRKSLFSQALAALPLVGAGILSAGSTSIGSAQAIPRITGQVESSQLVSLPGEVHPWARPQFDRGLAPANLNGRMLLVLRRSPEQESALQSLLASQQDPKSPNYHKWLTPKQFGAQFGVADADVQTMSGYLASRGMSVGRVYGNHMAMEVNATPAQMRSTFQTEIHAYSVGGKIFYANATAPQIPSALRGVVTGFASLNNFRVAGGSGAGKQGTLDPGTHIVKPLYTVGNTGTYGVAPGDLAAIYNIPATTGKGKGGANVNVGVVGDSNINIGYINKYRSLFGLSANPPIVVIDGNDPGINNDVYIAYKQIELLGAVAPNANILYYTSADTDYDTGLNFAMARAVEDNQVQVLLNGFQACETALGAEMAFINQLAEQATAQGITVVAAAGNSGAAGCEVPGTASPASTGFAVNGYASSPYATAVGGTDFYYGTFNPPTSYWKTTNSTTYTSIATATTHIPEQAWNDSNTNLGTSVILAGGGGASTAGLDGASTPQPIPSYQSGNAGVTAISSTARVIPDVSFFAGSGANNSMGYNNTAYVFCMDTSDCQTGSGAVQFTYSGGTEASSAVFAGAVALAVNNLNATSRFGLGNVNPTLYALFGNNIFGYDIARGNNQLKCTGSTNCNRGTMTAYRSVAGYDGATGLGSFDISSFVTNYAPVNTSASAVTISVTDPITGLAPVCKSGNVVTPNCTMHSYAVRFTVSATPVGAGATPTGDVAIFTSNPLASNQAVESLTLVNGTATDGTYNLLPGGTYKIYARYAGDATYAPSVTATPYTITVKPEACAMVLYDHNISSTTSNLAYGSPVSITVEPYSTLYPAAVAIPSGSINVSDTLAGITRTITTLPINSEGAATFRSNLLTYGLHSIVLAYPGDASFGTCQTDPFSVNITKANTTTQLLAPENDPGAGTNNNLGITAVVQSSTIPSNGTSPTGTVTFSTKTPQTVALISGFDPNGNALATASITIGQDDIPTSGSISATYNPAGTELNYNGSTSAATTFRPTVARTNDNTVTSFTITDNNGTYNADGSALSFPAQDSMTLKLHVGSAASPNTTVFLVYANGVELSPAITKNAQGFVVSGGLPIDSNGNATFTIPQQNGYLALPSGQVQLSVIYDGWYASDGSQQSNPSSANQIVTIVDDRTSADFSLQSDITVNHQTPLVSPTAQASYNLRLTSIYNFLSAYSTTPINLSCSVIGYANTSGVRSAPAGLACGFNSALSATTVSPTFAANSSSSGFISQTLYVGAASGYSVSSNSIPAQPATRWWLATGGATLACIFLLGLPARRRNWQSLLGVFVMAIVGFGITGCGTLSSSSSQPNFSSLGNGSTGSNGSGGTSLPAGTYTVLVTASTTTNTTLVHTLPLQVIVGSGN